ncbi:MAG: hypothetical protein M3Y87_20295 [Myxococcota bacterium]|nr:hypothetical protein [Myxococcota bacterium]
MRTTCRTPSRAELVLGTLTLAVAFAALGLLGPTSAHAQSIMINVPSFLGRDAPVLLHGMNGRPISGEECTTNVPIPIQLTNLPFSTTESRFLSVWRGTPTSAACQTATNRRATGPTDPPCTFVTSFPITSMTMDVTLPAQTAFGACDVATTQEFWFLGVPAAEDNTTDVPTGEYTYGSLTIGLDPTPPADPTGLEPSAGDRQIQIAWDNPEGVESLSGANVYVDTSGCDASGNVIAGGTLTDGGAPPSTTPIAVNGLAVRSATLDGEALGIAIGEYAAIAVSIVDRANNESNLSNVVCVQRVEVRGFWDAYCAERGLEREACTSQYGCSAGPSSGGRGSLAGMALVLGAIAFASRRRALARRSR